MVLVVVSDWRVDPIALNDEADERPGIALIISIADGDDVLIAIGAMDETFRCERLWGI
jgi:hypothetical protein